MEDIMDQNSKICKYCVHYRRHYILDKERCNPVNCGHCAYPGIKRREPGTEACVHFEYYEHSLDLPDRQEVISYLTTDFLKEMLEKMVPPVVEEDEGFEFA